MRVARVGWTGYRLPFKKSFVAADKGAKFRHGLFLRIEGESGLVGFGEASPVGPASSSSVAAISEELRLCAPVLLGVVITDEASVGAALAPLSGRSSSLRFGIATALYDLLAKSRGIPVASLFGGSPKTIPVNALLASASAEETAREGKKAVAEGFSTLKLKVGALTVEEDMRRLATLREAVGAKISLRLDANGVWTVREAIEAIDLLGQWNVEYVEQPVPPGDFAGLAAVRKAVATPIAADESVTHLQSALSLIKIGAVDFFVLKLARTGWLETREIIKQAKIARLETVITSSLEADVGLAASLHFASSCGLTGIASGLATGSLLESRLVTVPLGVSGGYLSCPHGPGLGVTPDWVRLKRYGTDIHGLIPD